MLYAICVIQVVSERKYDQASKTNTNCLRTEESISQSSLNVHPWSKLYLETLYQKSGGSTIEVGLWL